MLSTFEKTKTHEDRRAAIQRQMEAMETLGSKRNIISTSSSLSASSTSTASGKRPSGSLETARKFLWDEDDLDVSKIVSSLRPKKNNEQDVRNLYSTASYKSRNLSADSSIFSSLRNLLSDNNNNNNNETDGGSSQPSRIALSRDRLILPVLSCFDWMTRNQRGRNSCIFLAVIFVVAIPILLFFPSGNNDDNFHYSTRGSFGRGPSLTRSVRHEAVSKKILNSGITTQSLLDQLGTPQRKAFNWIVVEDPAQLDPNDEYILSRYSLAVFYFSTHGEEMIFEPTDKDITGPILNSFPEPITRPNKLSLGDGDEVTTIGDLAYEPNWINEKGWLSGSGYCSWYGIECHHRNGTSTTYDDNNGIILLNLTENNVRGKIQSELFLTNTDMRGLSLSGNGFFGTVPSEIGTLTQLQYLSLANNFFTGTLPTTFTKMTNVDQLFLDGNYLSGPFLPTVGTTMTNLESISIYDNQFSGTIPESLGNLKNLNTLYMDINRFTGSIPASFSDKMKDLRLRNNQLTGSIPDSLWNNNNSSLEILYLDNNKFTGTISTNLRQMTHLHELHLHMNELDGSIPTEVGFLKELKTLYMDNNKLSGEIPTEFGELTVLEQMYLHKNKLVQSIPSNIGKMENLRDLHLYTNFLTGSIPSEITKLQKLESIELQDNRITGTLPNLTQSNLEKILIYSNNIQGTVSQKICSNKGLTEFKSDCAGDDPKVVCSCCTKCV